MEKNLKIKFILIIIAVAIIVSIIMPYYDSYRFENSFKDEFIEYLMSIEDEERRKQEINSAIEKGWINEKDIERYTEGKYSYFVEC